MHHMGNLSFQEDCMCMSIYILSLTSQASLQKCDAVVVETLETQQPVEKSDITNYFESTLGLSSAGKEETISVEFTSSRLSNTCARGQKIDRNGEHLCENPNEK